MGGNGGDRAMFFKLHAAGACGLSALTPAPGTVPGDALGTSCQQVAQCLSFSAGLFHVARCLRGSSALWHASAFPSFLWLETVALCGCGKCSPLTWRWTFGVWPPFGSCESCCCEHGYATSVRGPAPKPLAWAQPWACWLSVSLFLTVPAPITPPSLFTQVMAA